MNNKRLLTIESDIITTCRLILRRWKESDANDLFKYASDPDVGPHAGWPPHMNVKESLQVIRNIFNNDCTWAVVLKDTEEVIGCMGYYLHGVSNIGIGDNDAEVGYWIGKPHWNKGICTEALQAMIQYCRDNRIFDTLWADFFVNNPASGRVMEKCGFHDTGEINYCSNLLHGEDTPVHIMKLKLGKSIDTTNMCSHLQKKLLKKDGIYYPIWQAIQADDDLTAVVRSRQLHIYRNGKKVLVLAGKAQPKIIREDKLDELLNK